MACEHGDIASLRAELPGLAVVLLKLELDGEVRRRAAEWGGVQVVDKSMPADRLVEVLRNPRQGFV